MSDQAEGMVGPTPTRLRKIARRGLDHAAFAWRRAARLKGTSPFAARSTFLMACAKAYEEANPDAALKPEGGET